MIVINTVDAERFTLDGIEYFKNFTPVVAGDTITISNTYGNCINIVKSTNYANFTVNGNTFLDVASLQSALLPVIYTRDTLGGGAADLDEKDILSFVATGKETTWGFGGTLTMSVGTGGSGSSISAPTTSAIINGGWNKRQQTSIVGVGNPYSIYSTGRYSLVEQGFYFRCESYFQGCGGSSVFVGLDNSVADLGNVDPSTLLNVFGVGKDEADTTLHVFHNDNAGLASKIDLGVNFDVTTNIEPFKVELFKGKGVSDMFYRVSYLDLSQDTGWVSVSTNVPLPNYVLSPKCSANRRNDVTGVALMQLNFISIYV